jgi:selenocysteine lyase/cysteine desulfurase/tryptophan 2,3-dioxygenase
MLGAMDRFGLAWGQFEQQVSIARSRFASLIGARPEQIAVLPNASVGAYQVASTIRWDRRPTVVTTAAEFPSVAHVWLAQRPRGAEVLFVPEREGSVRAADYLASLDERTGLVSIPLTTYASGARLPAAEIAAAARAAGARSFVDAYQALGVEPVDVAELGCDFLVAGSMKYLLGLPGVAFLYARDGLAGDCPPQLTGWFGRVDPFAFDPFVLDFPEEARRFETGTPAVPALYAANAGLELVGGLDLHAVHAHVRELVASAVERLAAQGERLSIPPYGVRAEHGGAARGAHVAIFDHDPGALAGWLAQRGIVVSPRGQFVRIAFHYYNTDEDLAGVCDAVAEYRARGAGCGPRSPGARAAVEAWMRSADPDDFPYDAVVREYRAVGKHFVPGGLLEALAGARSLLRQNEPGEPGERGPGAAEPASRLERFLDTALDKHDGRYDYPSYLGLSLLDLPSADPPHRDTTCAERRSDRLLTGLVCDALGFELAAAGGATEFLPEMRPGPATTVKRCRLGLRAIRPALGRQDVDADPDPADPVAEVARICHRVAGTLDGDDRRVLQLSMLPVYVVHDECLFIRVLQSFETSFSRIAVLLRAAASALVQGDAAPAQEWIERAEAAQSEAAPLFSLLATMQVEAFRTFRAFTEGASAIQSRTYKTVESLCRMPERPRLDSLAYRSVPEVRERVLAGQATLEDALERVVRAHWLSAGEHTALAHAMGRFADTLLRWRETHYRLAVRMLGERPGTGYTEGTPYLRSVRKIPVFASPVFASLEELGL